MVILYKPIRILKSLEILPNLSYMLHKCLRNLAGFKSADAKVVHYCNIIGSQSISIV
jgi:hypothetical protein